MLHSRTHRKGNSTQGSICALGVVWILIFFLFSGVLPKGVAQSASLIEPFELAQLQELQKGILIVVIERSELSGILSGSKSDGWKSRQAKEDTDAIIHAFTNSYSFSQLAFAFVDALPSIKEGELDGNLLGPNMRPFPPAFSKGRKLFIAEFHKDQIPSWTEVRRYKKEELVWSYPKGIGGDDAMRFEKIKNKYKSELEVMLAADSLKLKDEAGASKWRKLSAKEKQELELELSKMDQVGFVPENGAFLYEQLKYSPNYIDEGGLLIQRAEDQVVRKSPKKVYVVNFHHFQRIDWQVSSGLRYKSAVESLNQKLDQRIEYLDKKVSRNG